MYTRPMQAAVYIDIGHLPLPLSNCSYIEEDRELQEEFVTLLDRLCHSGGRLLAG